MSLEEGLERGINSKFIQGPKSVGGRGGGSIVVVVVSGAGAGGGGGSCGDSGGGNGVKAIFYSM